jgi:hypothetical protein
MGWGVVQYRTTAPHLPTPTPILSPQGGGEEFVAPANRIFARIATSPAVTSNGPPAHMAMPPRVSPSLNPGHGKEAQPC